MGFPCSEEIRFFDIVTDDRYNVEDHNKKLKTIVSNIPKMDVIFMGSSFGRLCYTGSEESDRVIKIVFQNTKTKVVEVDEEHEAL